ncbi:MFS transporter [Streptomyces purpureus]|uniref:MFS transporter n=1 Tax=Streptomyces purpureus TaxID=1951 RepID=UPI0037AC90EC
MRVPAITATLPSGAARKPILLMTLGAFALGTDAFVISGVLPAMGQSLGVSLETAGLLITVFAGVYALGAPFLAVATGSLDRGRVITIALAGFVAANVLAAVAPNYTVLMAARVLAALSAALFMPAASASAAAVAAPEERGRALTTVLGGLTLASALGVPIGTLVGHVANWRATFVLVAVLSLVALVGLARALPPTPAANIATLADRARAAKLPGIPAILLGSMLTYCSMFTLYAYIPWFAERTAGIGEGAVSWVYLLYGLCGVLSNMAAGWLIDTYPPQRVAVLASALMAVVLGLLTLFAWAGPSGTAVSGVLLYVLIALWGLIGWVINPAQQKRLIVTAGPRGPVALSLNGSAVYAGQAVGGLAGGMALSHGAIWLMATSVALQLLAIAVVCLSARARNTTDPAPAAPATSASPAAPAEEATR